MRKIFFLLMLANAVLFAFIYFDLFPWSKPAKALQAPLNPEKIRLVDMSKSIDIKPRGGAPKESESIPDKSTIELSVKAEANPVICFEWGDFSGSGLEQASAALAGLNLSKERLSLKEIEHDTGYWVYMPPYKSKRMVNKKLGELKELGVNEYFVIPSGKWKYAISLGVFKTREGAQSFFDQVRSKGVRSARLGERASKFKTTVFVFDGVSNEIREKVLGFQKEFATSELQELPCGLTR